MELNHIKVIIFDLDGTLYEDIHHFDFYAERLKEKLEPQYQIKFLEDYRLALEGNHPLKIGRVYDVDKDLILVQMDGVIKEAYHWRGANLSKEDISLLYPKKISINLESMLSIGDLWWVPAAIARHYGLKKEQSNKAFLETREFMMGPEFKMNPVLGMKETLQNLQKNIKLVLLTNSPQPDSEAILRKLGLNDVFNKKIYNARKPTHTEEQFASISKQFNVKFTDMLSIGDNWLNEILPAKKLGCSTIFIDPHHVGNDVTADHSVDSISEMVSILKVKLEAKFK